MKVVTSRSSRVVLALSLIVTAGVAVPLWSAQAAQPASTARACPTNVSPAEARDVPAGSKDIECLLWWGIASGTSDGHYQPEGLVARGQMATFLARTVARVSGTLPPDPRTVFDDLAGDVHQDAAQSLADLGIVRGVADGQFAPGRAVSRAQMATFLVRLVEYLKGQPLPAGPDAFTDDQGSVHEASINKLAAAGITTGTGQPGRYLPDGTVSRAQMASFVMRAVDASLDEQATVVAVQVSGIDDGRVGALRDGGRTRVAQLTGAFASHEGAQVFLPPMYDGQGALFLPQGSPLLVPSGAFASLSASYSPGDVATPDPASSAAMTAYAERWFSGPSRSVTADWTGDLGSCRAGTVSAAYRQAELDAINAARRLIALPDVTDDPALSAQAQQAALVMAAQGELSHDPPSSWRCWTETAHAAAGRSNLHLLSGPGAIIGYLQDPGESNGFVGHRRWVLSPAVTRVGLGDVQSDTGAANALQVIGDGLQPPPADYVASWPAPGFFPADLLGDTHRWSVHTGSPLSDVSVSALVDGQPVTPVLEPSQGGYGSVDAVVFELPGVEPYVPVDVTVTATTDGGKPFRREWQTTLVPS